MSGPLSNPFMFKSAAGAGDFYSHQIANSLRFPGGTSSSLTNTNLSAGNRRTWTFSLWVKKHWLQAPVNEKSWLYGVSTGGATYAFWGFERHSSNAAYMDEFKFEETSGSTQSAFTIKDSEDKKFRDPSAWYHVVLAIDTTQSTAGNRQKVWINGEAQTLTVTTQMAQDYEFSFINNGEAAYAKMSWLDGLEDTQLAELHFLDGVAADADDFGETKNGVWIPKEYSGSFGNEGYYLKFTNSSDLGEDFSGNDNDFTANNLSAHDQMKDSPTFNSSSNGGNFCTYNPLVAQGGAQKLMTLREGNLLAESETNDKYHQTIGTMGVKTGKWYIEWYVVDDGYPSFAVGWHYGSQLGLFNGSSGLAATANMAYMGYFTGSTVYLTPFGNTGTNPTNPNHSSFTNQGAPATDDILMCAIDFDAGKGWWGINGVWGDVGSGTGNPATGANASVTWTASDYDDYKFPFTLAWANPDTEIVMNCGQEGTFAGSTTAGGNADDTGYGNFKYDVPAGFLALCSGNLPVADEIDPAQTSSNYPQKLFSATLYAGNGSTSARDIDTGVAADWVWIKNYGANSSDHMLYDSSRGVGKYIRSNKNVVEDTSGTSLSAFNSDGFQLSDNGTYLNASSNNYVAWNWRAGDGSTSSGSGDLTSTHQVDPSGGFSIVKAVGDGSGSGDKTVTHGMSAAPDCIIAKNLDSTFNWDTYWSSGLTSGYGLRLNTNDNQLSGRWGTVNSSIFTCKWNYTWVGSDNFIYYCFRDIEGYIKVGTYTGNASDDGSFVYCGFRPAFLLLREVAADNWGIYDNKRAGQNNDDGDGNAVLYADEAYDEENQASRAIDLLSNGFKLRTSNATFNASGTYVFLAVARNPFKYATAR